MTTDNKEKWYYHVRLALLLDRLVLLKLLLLYDILDISINIHLLVLQSSLLIHCYHFHGSKWRSKEVLLQKTNEYVTH